MAKDVNVDVIRQFHELYQQLVADGFDSSSGVVGKSFLMLGRALKEDGFPISIEDIVMADTKTNLTKATKGPEGTTSHSGAAEDTGHAVVRAFRVRGVFDLKVVESLFSLIGGGWKAKPFEHKGNHFIVVTDAPRLTEKRIRTAVVNYLKDAKASA